MPYFRDKINISHVLFSGKHRSFSVKNFHLFFYFLCTDMTKTSAARCECQAEKRDQVFFSGRQQSNKI